MSLVGVIVIVTGNKSNSNLSDAVSFPISAILITMINPMSIAVVNIALRKLRYMSIHP